jgi:penicillin-binding protein 1A
MPEAVETNPPDQATPAPPDRVETRRRRWTIGRTIAWSALVLAVVAVAGSLALWVLSPSASDLQGRVDAQAALHGVPRLQPGEVPPLLAEAIVATEDERFYQHHGIDVIGLGRALLYDVTHLCSCQGGSTITQQLVKDLYLNGSDSGVMKLVDIALAFKVELQYSKQQILADYLSEVLAGDGVYGMPAAACADFGRPLAALDLGQIALLAGMPQAPSAYDPRFDPVAAAARRTEVLASMVSEGFVTPQEAATAATEPVVVHSPSGRC